ncbi:MAG: cytochrome c-type biogenesis protein [Pseudomonadota bacterium]
MIRVLLLWLALTLPAVAALGPDDKMADPLLNTRAMALYDALRCVRCRSESIASSNADWARDARAVVRERLLAGDTDTEVLHFFQARYGDYVLMSPPMRGATIALWLTAPTFLLMGLIGAATLIRRRRADPQPEELSPAEAARVERLLSDPPG